MPSLTAPTWVSGAATKGFAATMAAAPRKVRREVSKDIFLLCGLYMGDIERHMARSDCGQAKASHTRRCGRLLSAQPLFAGRRSIPAALEFRLATRHQGAGVVGRGPQRFVVRGGTRSTAFGPALKRKTDLDAVL